jgi:hypothetical protein
MIIMSMSSITTTEIILKDLTTFPKDICDMDELEKIELHFIDGVEIDMSENMENLQKLTSLKIYNGIITNIDSSFGLLPLVELYFVNTKFAIRSQVSIYRGKEECNIFPLVICNLKNMHKLVFQNNGITNLPHAIREIGTLDVLCLYDNTMEYIDIGALSCLKVKMFYINIESITLRNVLDLASIDGLKIKIKDYLEVLDISPTYTVYPWGIELP